MVSHGAKNLGDGQAATKHENVTLYTDGELLASVNAPANGGKANNRLIELLAEYFHTAKSNIRILRGQRSRRKLIEVD
jgi:uncharacterized protein YggU (UPF0235/DUF167 family)